MGFREIVVVEVFDLFEDVCCEVGFVVFGEYVLG